MQKHYTKNNLKNIKKAYIINVKLTKKERTSYEHKNNRKRFKGNRRN